MRRLSVGLDFIVIVVFVAIGRSVHDHGVRIAGLASTTWPFLVGMLLGSLVVFARGWSATTVASGATVATVTVAIGMVLRAVADQGVAIAFVFVALAFLGFMMLGWRLAFAGLQRLRRSRAEA